MAGLVAAAKNRAWPRCCRSTTCCSASRRSCPARDPKLFLFDEPLSNLDAKLRVEMRAEIKLIHQRTRTTTVYVTHDQVEAMTLGDRIAVMREGAVEQLDTPERIYSLPATRFVAEFIGSPQMNLIECPRVGLKGRMPGRLAGA